MLILDNYYRFVANGMTEKIVDFSIYSGIKFITILLSIAYAELCGDALSN